MDELFPAVKTALRLTVPDDDLDNEINDLIQAARMDLHVVGLVSADFSTENAALIKQAIILYTKGNWGYDNPDAPRFLATYEDLKVSLALHSLYDPVGDAE